MSRPSAEKARRRELRRERATEKQKRERSVFGHPLTEGIAFNVEEAVLFGEGSDDLAAGLRELGHTPGVVYLGSHHLLPGKVLLPPFRVNDPSCRWAVHLGLPQGVTICEVQSRPPSARSANDAGQLILGAGEHRFRFRNDTRRAQTITVQLRSVPT